ncbi:MAG: DUF1343 domain-containing protein [Acidobacteriota bacterium]
MSRRLYNYPRSRRFAAICGHPELFALPVALSAALLAAGCSGVAGGDTGAGVTPAPAAAAPQRATGGAVLPGIDVWRARGFAPLAGKRVGLISNLTGRDAAGVLTAEVLRRAPEITLAALFSPEHGFAGVEEGDVASATDAAGLVIHSLYGDTRRPTAEMLAGLDGLVFDIQDIGTRFYTYATTMAYAMEEAAAHGLPFVVLDRPDPITGSHIEGPLLHDELRSFVGYAPIPLRHGMTMGELARYFNEERGIGADLTVVEVQGWRRVDWYDATGLLWIDPSPNMRNLVEAALYPAVGPLETTNVSVGRGTDEPFEWFGAPWIDARRLAAHLNAAGLAGIRFVPRRRTPASSVYEGEPCAGVDLLLTDRDAFDAGITAATLIHALYTLYPEDWDTSSLPRLWGRPEIVDQLAAGLTAADIAAAWQPDLDAFLRVRARYLLYD